MPGLVKELQPEQGTAGAILMEYLKGTVLKKTDLTEKLAYETGEILGQIHQNRVEKYGDPTQPRDLNKNPAVHFALKFEEGLSECSMNLTQELLKKSRRYFDTHLPLLASFENSIYRLQ